LKVLLINPPGWVGDRIPLGYDLVPSVPLGLGYLASTMESEGITAKIVDMDWGGFSKEELVDMISKFDPDIIGITSFTSNYANAVDIAKAAKSHNPNIKIVFGGVHATFIHRDVLHTIPEVDIVVRYEGERAICEICDALDRGRKLENVKGISFRHDNRVFSTPLRHRIENLDSIPFPAFHLLEPSIEHYIGEGKEKGFPIITTRGCPFNCIFCSTAALHGRKYRTRSANNVLDEMEFHASSVKTTIPP
jgi:anaerobic magnesium-protoporphyrin IX monomethyl ester cyclase